MLIGEFCQEICAGDNPQQYILRLLSGKPIRALFIDAVKFQSGWYHGLHLKYLARPNKCSGWAFFVDQMIRLAPIRLANAARSYPRGSQDERSRIEL